MAGESCDLQPLLYNENSGEYNPPLKTQIFAEFTEFLTAYCYAVRQLFTSLSIAKLKEETYRSNAITDTIAVIFITRITVGFFKRAMFTFLNLLVMAPNRSSAIFLERYPPNYLAVDIKLRGKSINKHEFSNLLHRESGGYVISA